jgi:hypothetical protein
VKNCHQGHKFYQQVNIPFIPDSLDNHNTIVNSDLKPEPESEPKSSILNVNEEKEDKSKDSNDENKDSSSSSSSSGSETKRIINI